MAPEGLQSRMALIEEALGGDSLLEILQEWMWVNNIDEAWLLSLKTWFQLSYADLAKLFRLSRREIAQKLRNQRMNLVSVRRASGDEDVHGISCFMVEQHLSSWLDGEIEEMRVMSSIFAHLEKCHECRERLEEFRNLQAKVLSLRKSYAPISQEEWIDSVNQLKIERQRSLQKLIFFGILMILALSILTWFILSKPEKIPNIYEIS